MRILIVDDNKIDREIIKKFINTHLQIPLSIDEAFDGLEAMAKYKESILQDNVYDIILMDIEMPKLDGIAASQRIKAIKPNQFIIITSSHKNYIGNISGAIASIKKPYTNKELLDVLELPILLINKEKKLASLESKMKLVEKKLSELE